MNTNRCIGTSSRRFLVVFLSLCLLLPSAALADGKNGKKNFKEGIKYEQLQQWDMAAQRFALALSAEPNNPEYKVHYLQALSRASLMYITRGDALAEQNDYAGAYIAYRQAYSYDPGNEISKFKMERMLELQKAQVSGTSEQINYNTKTGTTRPVGREIQLANKSRARGEITTDVHLTGAPLKHTVKSLAAALELNVIFDDSVRDTEKVTIDLDKVTTAKALDFILMQKKLAFEQVDRRTIFVYPDNTNNRPRFEKLLIKTFYLNNISAQTAKNVLAQMLPPGRQAATVDSAGGTGGPANSNVLIVKATPAELQLVQDLIANIDKNKNEVVLDIEIYEVANDSLVQIGNQFATSPVQAVQNTFNDDGSVKSSITTQSPSLGNLGGVGLGIINGLGDSSIGGNLFSPFLGGVGTLIGFPPSSLSLLQSRGKSKLLHKTQIHVLDGGENKTKVGRRVPVRLGTQLVGGGINFGGLGGNNNNNNGGIGQNIGNALASGLGGFGGFNNGFDSIQYQDVGLVIEAKPTITTEGYVEIKMNFETSGVEASAGDVQNLTPTFTQRSLNTTARIQDGVTAVVAGVNQDTKSDSRAGIPVLGMLPLVGRLFATPRQQSNQTDVIITVTPHIVRSAGITANDYLAHIGPPQQGGMNQSIEDVINRAQVEEDQEQRLIAAEQQAPGAPLNAQPANFNNQQRPGVSQPANFDGQQFPGAGSKPAIQPVNNPSNRGAIGGVLAPGSVNPTINAQPAVPDKRQAEAPVAPNGANELSSSQPGATDAAVASLRPENVDRAVSRMLAEERVRKIGPADNASSTVNFNLSPKPIKERVGKNFTVTIDVSGEQQMSGADIALKYDASKLQVKSVRDGGLFGQQPDFSYDKKQQGVLIVSVKHPHNAPTATSGRLVTVEFSAIGEGQSEIALSSGQTRARVGATQIPVAGSAVQVIIGRDTASSSNEE